MVQLASDAVRETRAAKLIVLDRDGVINHDSDQLSSRRTNGGRFRAASRRSPG